MDETFLRFPENFKWGSATSAHQIEGGNHNDWSAWEQSPKRISELKRQGSNPADFISGKACDSYHRFREDLDIAKELGHTIHRFSIEWSRIEPEEGKFDQTALTHYSEVIDAIRERGMEPMVTLWHFTSPVWFARKGGFLNPDSPELYKRLIEHVVDNFSDRVGLWITFNEATVYASHSYLWDWPPQEKNIFHWWKVRKNIMRAHLLAYQAIKKRSMSHNVGAVESNAYLVGNSIATRIGNYLQEQFWSSTLPYQDFLGLNYYTVRRIPRSSKALPKLPVAPEMDWEIYPKGIYERLKALKKFRKPIFITENGMADRTDHLRSKFIRDHLAWIHRAIKDGVDVRGYLYWSLLDNFEWARGFGPRFGLVEIDYTTFQRTVRPSAREYATIIRDNGLQWPGSILP